MFYAPPGVATCAAMPYRLDMPENHLTLDAIARELADNLARADALRHAHAEAALTRCPAPGAWSAAHCVAHLKITTEQYRIPLAQRIAKHRQANRTSDDPHIRPGWFNGWFIQQASPEGRRKLPAPKAFKVVPHDDVPLDVFDGFAAGQSDLQAFIESARGLDLNRGKLASPVTPLIRFSIGETFLLLARHQARHLKQAEAAAEASS